MISYRHNIISILMAYSLTIMDTTNRTIVTVMAIILVVAAVLLLSPRYYFYAYSYPYPRESRVGATVRHITPSEQVYSYSTYHYTPGTIHYIPGTEYYYETYY